MPDEWEDFLVQEGFKPAWNNTNDKNSRILIRSEQGIGDNFRFLSALPTFLKTYPNVIIEPPKKMTEILESTFPEIQVRSENFHQEHLNCQVEDFDYQLPVGTMFSSMLATYHNKLENENFSLGWSYLKPDKLRKNFWKLKLDNLSSKPKIGFLWRSSLNTKDRERHYTQIDRWKSLLLDERYSFVNLQYDLTHDEFISENDYLGNYFLDTGYLDQKDDLEGAASLISNLDLVISPASSPSMISSSLNVPTIIYSDANVFWFGRLGRFKKHPIFGNTTCYFSKNPFSDQLLIEDIRSYVNNYFFDKKQISNS